MKTALKLLTALATIAGVVYVVATYGDKIVEWAKEVWAAMLSVGMDAREVPIRGGTDGARLSYEGLPCPNLCTGGENFHGRFEFVPVEDMELCVKMLLEILYRAE